MICADSCAKVAHFATIARDIARFDDHEIVNGKRDLFLILCA